MSSVEPKRPILNWVLNGGVAVALIASLSANAFQYYQMRETQALSYQFTQIEEFKTSGEELDQITAKYFDSLAKNEDGAALKLRFEEVYIRHVTVAESDREILGPLDTDNYLLALGVLRNEVEQAKGPTGAGARIEALANVIATRRKLSENALDI